MRYLHFIIVYAGPFVALALIYLLWAYTAYRWRNKSPAYYNFVCRINGQLPKIIAFVCITGFILYMFGIFESLP